MCISENWLGLPHDLAQVRGEAGALKARIVAEIDPPAGRSCADLSIDEAMEILVETYGSEDAAEAAVDRGLGIIDADLASGHASDN